MRAVTKGFDAPGWLTVSFWLSGTLALIPERQSARKSKTKKVAHIMYYNCFNPAGLKQLQYICCWLQKVENTKNKSSKVKCTLLNNKGSRRIEFG